MTRGLTIENAAYFERLADVEARHWWSRGMWRIVTYWLDQALAGRAGLQALDIGCGAGVATRRLSQRPEIAATVALDPNPEALAVARWHDCLLPLRGDVKHLPFEDAQFDVVTCFDVFQHLPRGGDRAAAAELRRVLSPGGVAVVRANGRGFSGNELTYSLRRLADVLGESGLIVHRATYANVLPALAQEGRGWLVRTVNPSRTGSSSAGHPSGKGLCISVPHPAVNRVMAQVSAAEAWAAGRLNLRLPFGHSTLALAVRPGLIVTDPANSGSLCTAG
jgi:SAM-dependent methyltransferase